jgi:hypothetical protein
MTMWDRKKALFAFRFRIEQPVIDIAGEPLSMFYLPWCEILIVVVRRQRPLGG